MKTQNWVERLLESYQRKQTFWVLSISAFVKFVAQLFGRFRYRGCTPCYYLRWLCSFLEKMSMLLILPGILVTVGLCRNWLVVRFTLLPILQRFNLGLLVLWPWRAMLFSAKPGMLDLTNWNLYTIGFFVHFISLLATSECSIWFGIRPWVGYYRLWNFNYLVVTLAWGMIGTIFSLTDSIASSFTSPIVWFGFVLIIGLVKVLIRCLFSTDLKIAFSCPCEAVIPLPVLSVSLFLMKFYKLDREEIWHVFKKIYVMKSDKDRENVCVQLRKMFHYLIWIM